MPWSSSNFPSTRTPTKSPASDSVTCGAIFLKRRILSVKNAGNRPGYPLSLRHQGLVVPTQRLKKWPFKLKRGTNQSTSSFFFMFFLCFGGKSINSKHKSYPQIFRLPLSVPWKVLGWFFITIPCWGCHLSHPPMQKKEETNLLEDLSLCFNFAGTRSYHVLSW